MIGESRINRGRRVHGTTGGGFGRRDGRGTSAGDGTGRQQRVSEVVLVVDVVAVIGVVVVVVPHGRLGQQIRVTGGPGCLQQQRWDGRGRVRRRQRR